MLSVPVSDSRNFDMEYKIDAAGESMGRIASRAASILMGKNYSGFRRNVASAVSVRIFNASRINMSQRKRQTKFYTRYSGYPGGLKRESLDSLLRRRGIRIVLEEAIRGMLPRNSLRKKMLLNLRIEP